MPFVFNTRQKSVAFFSLVGVLLLITLLGMIARSSDLLTMKEDYYTLLTDGYGFSSGMSVKYKGFNVGKINKISLTDQDMIRLDIAIFKQYTRLIKKESVFKVSSNFLGSSSLVLVPAEKASSPLVAPRSLVYSSDMDEGKAILKGQEGSGGGGNEELIRRVNLILDDVHELKPVLEDLLKNASGVAGNVDSLMASFKGTENTALSRRIFGMLDNIVAMTANLRDVSSDVNSDQNSVGFLLKDNKQLYNRIDHILANLEGTSNDLKKFSGEALGSPEDVRETVNLLKANLVELRKVLRGMQNIVGSGTPAK